MLFFTQVNCEYVLLIILLPVVKLNDGQAKRQRTEYLRQRIRQRNSVRARNRMLKQADLLSRKLARYDY